MNNKHRIDIHVEDHTFEVSVIGGLHIRMNGQPMAKPLDGSVFRLYSITTTARHT